MADLAASIAKARKAGYTDAQIAAYIAKDPNMGPKVQRARQAGYNDAQIISHLAPKRGMVEDFGRSLVGGLKESVANIADTVGAASLGPTAVIGRMSTGNPFGLPTPMAVIGGGMFGRRAAATSDKPQGAAGNVGRAIGLNAPNAIAPGSAGQRVVNVFAPAIGGELAAGTAQAMGAGERGQEFARIGGSLAGAGVASLRPPNPFRRSDAPAVATVGQRTRQDPAALRQRAQEFRAAGIEPTFADVVDDAGRGVIRAAANRPTEGRQAANEFARSRARNLPNRLGARASEFISDDPRTLDDVTSDIGARIGQAATPPQAIRGAGGARVSERLNREFDQARSQVNDAYNAARAAAPEGAIIAQREKPQIAASLREAVRDYDPQDIAPLTRQLDGFDRLGTLSLRDLYEMRQRVNAVTRTNPNMSAPARAIVRAIDDAIGGAVDAGVVTGDPNVVGLWREAIGLRRQMGQRFQGGDAIEALTAREPRGGAMANRIAPEDASSTLLGRNGVAARTNSARDLSRIRDQLGADSPEWRALSDEALSRLMQQDAGRENYGQALQRFARENPELANVLFTPQQRAQVAQAQQQIAGALGQRQAVGVGGRFLQPGAGRDYAAQLGRVPQDALPEARLAARQAVQTAVGNRARNAPGVADALIAPEQQIRNEALLGPQRARQFEGAVTMERNLFDNASAIAPNRNSATFLNAADDANLDGANEVVQIGRQIVRRDVAGLAIRVLDRFKTRGLSDAQAEELVRVAIDPAQTDAAIDAIARSLAPAQRQEFLSLRNAALVGAISAGTGIQQAAP